MSPMPNFVKTAELTAIATSTAGAIATVITQQAVYAVAPMSVALSMGAINRHRLEQQLRGEQQHQAIEIKAQSARIGSEIRIEVEQALQESEVGIEHEIACSEEAQHHLLFGRAASRELLIETLTLAEDRVVLVCPWLKKYALDGPLLYRLQSSLKRGVRDNIGWGRLQDLESNSYRNSVFYDALPLLEQLAKQHHNLELKALGTHEKFLVCDRSLAAIGSHNFLTSDNGWEEREVSLRTTDQQLIL